MWLDDAVVYQVYIRSFQDSDGDGVGDLPGVTSRLEHIAGLGAAAVWLSPIYPSPNADFGYDVADYMGVDPGFGTLADFDALLARARALGLRVILDFVPCHTSIEHPWFRTHPEYYVWADSPPNNWMASFGGTAWERDRQTGRFYLHSFFPEQADLDWHNPEVRRAMGGALRFWRERGVDGFRLDALDKLLKDPQLRDDPPAGATPQLPLDPEYATLDHSRSSNHPDIGGALRAIRDAAGEDAALIGEVYLRADQLTRYLESLDAAFAFEVMQAAPTAAAIRAGLAASLCAGKNGWVLSNHDFHRLGTRYGPENARAMAMLLLSLPGPGFVFQGDELGMVDSPPEDPPLDRFARDGFRHPLPWDQSAHGGFTSGEPWLPVGDGIALSVAEQEADPNSQLSLIRRLIALKGKLHGPAELLDSAPDTVVLARGEHLVAVNLADQPRPVAASGEILIEANSGDGSDLNSVPPHGGWVARMTQ